jgi:hypothetical protein
MTTNAKYNPKVQFLLALCDRDPICRVSQVRRSLDKKGGVLFGRIGRAGLSFNYVALENKTRIELLIQSKDAKERLRTLKQSKTEIERAFGGALDWLEKAETTQCRIFCEIEGGYRSLRDEWPRIHAELTEAMRRLEGALGALSIS